MMKAMILVASLVAALAMATPYTTDATEPMGIGYTLKLGRGQYVFEFTPRNAPNMWCVYVTGHKQGGLDCFRSYHK